jgi:hypothetical protein
MAERVDFRRLQLSEAEVKVAKERAVQGLGLTDDV